MGNGGAHGQTIRAVAITNPGNEGRLKGPHRVAETLALMVAKGSQGFIFCEHFKSVRVGSSGKARIHSPHDIGKCPAVRTHAHSIAVPFFFAHADVTADAGHADDGIDEAEYLFDLLQGDHLAEVHLLHPPGDHPLDHAADQAR